MKKLLLSLLALLLTLPSVAEDGHRLWLRYDTLNLAKVKVQGTKAKAQSPVEVAVNELRLFAKAKEITLKLDRTMPDNEGFRLTTDARQRITISARRDVGLLYGAYKLLELEHKGATSNNLQLPATGTHEAPFFNLRLLNHWDNLDGSIERGYAGESIFEWFHLDRQLIEEYARANASIGINGSVLNNVNASPKILTAP